MQHFTFAINFLEFLKTNFSFHLNSRVNFSSTFSSSSIEFLVFFFFLFNSYLHTFLIEYMRNQVDELECNRSDEKLKQ